MPKLGPWVEELEHRLEANEKKPRRDRLSLLRIHEDLAALGYGGGYDAVRRYARTWRRRWRLLSPSQAFVPLSFDPGEAYQFDWSHEYACLQPACPVGQPVPHAASLRAPQGATRSRSCPPYRLPGQPPPCHSGGQYCTPIGGQFWTPIDMIFAEVHQASFSYAMITRCTSFGPPRPSAQPIILSSL